MTMTMTINAARTWTRTMTIRRGDASPDESPTLPQSVLPQFLRPAGPHGRASGTGTGSAGCYRFLVVFLTDFLVVLTTVVAFLVVGVAAAAAAGALRLSTLGRATLPAL